MVIWDNRCSVHAATPDHVRQGLDSRVGVGATSIGERPYFDPLATGKREALAKGKRARGVKTVLGSPPFSPSLPTSC